MEVLLLFDRVHHFLSTGNPNELSLGTAKKNRSTAGQLHQFLGKLTIEEIAIVEI